MDEFDFSTLQECLTRDEISEISDTISKKLEIFFKSKLEEFITAKALFETNRKNLDKKLLEVTKNFDAQKKELENYKKNFDSNEKFLADIQNQLTNSRNELMRLQESIQSLEKENLELRRIKDEVMDENNLLHSQVERKNRDLERMKLELSSLGSQLQSAIANKCQALAEIEEIKSQEISLDFREKRLEQERSLLCQQIANLEEELVKRTNELQNTRTETSARLLITHTQLTQFEEELKISNTSLIQLREVNTGLQRRCEELTQKLEDQRNHELAMHASYREEVTAQTRLADLYKGMVEEANSKADDYSKAVKELQNLLEHATEEYGLLQSKYNESIEKYDRKIIEEQKRVTELMKELEHANELMSVLKQDRLDQTVEQLAPSAAVASKILRKGLSLTQIYTQLVQVTNDLCLEKAENEKLRSQMEIILKELEEKAPILQQQKENYETAMANITSLTLKIEELITENNYLQEHANEAKRLSNHTSRENQKLKLELADLARQVCYLLKEVQESQTGVNIPIDEVFMETDNLASSEIISKKLVTFKDIEGLQENNQKLLSIVRTLSCRQEEIEKNTDEINSGEMKKKLDGYIEQLSDMQAAQDRQAKMLENIIKQRDMYKNMYQERMNQISTSKNSDEHSIEPKRKESNLKNEITSIEMNENNRMDDKIKVWEDEYKKSEAKFIELQNDFTIYKKEKDAHEKMLTNEIEKLRKESEKNSTQCCRLKAQLDSANERFNLLQGNVSTYKSQIRVLEEKCQNYSTTIGKHEQTLMILKDEALTAQTTLAKAEVQLENLKQERQLLHDSENRLLKEREVLLRERHTHALLKADVEVIKASLERVQNEAQARTEQRLDDATRECAALRRRLQEEQDRFRELSAQLERQVTIIQDRLTQEKQLTDRIQNELNISRATEQEYIKKIDEMNSKLKQVTSVCKPITENDDSSKKIKELEMKLMSNQVELKTLSDQLKAARCQSQQYCDIAESAELQLRESMDQFNKVKEELESSLRSTQEELIISKEKIKEMEEKMSNISVGQECSNSEINEKLIEAEKKLEELNHLKNELELMKNDVQNANSVAAAAEEKYAREMVLHSADLQMLTKLKEENQAIAGKVAELIRQRDLAKETLDTEKSTWLEREKRLNNEMHELQKRAEDLHAQNSILHDQIQELSEKTALVYHQQSSSNECNLSKSIEFSEENSKSVEQLLQIIKYLRREKDLTIAKFDVLKSENTRLKSQIDLINKRSEEMKKLLQQERENNEIDVITATKHSELLRKVETLNAITDSNRILREERDNLVDKIKDLINKQNLLSDEVMPLREKCRDLETKIEALQQENSSLKAEALRWRQRANNLVERANKASPEDWRRLQTERENLSKLLTSERETYAKCTEELNNLKSEKLLLEDQLTQVHRQLQTKEEQITKMNEDIRRLNQDLNNSITELNEKTKNIMNLNKDLAEKETMLTDVKNKEIQIRKIAKKYKTQYEELSKNMEEEKPRTESTGSVQLTEGKTSNSGESQAIIDRENELTTKLDELNQQILVMQSESENLKKEIEVINKTSLEKEERAKQVLKGARTKIMQLTEYKKLCEKEMSELKEKLDSSTSECESNMNEYEARIAALKSQMESRISRLEHERSDLQNEKEALLQRAAQLQRQLAGQNSSNTGTNEPPTANIKPMSARTETPLASIRPMSVVVQSRTAAVLPTTAGTPLLLAAQQQVVHTTETSSPTSSHVDYQPASTSRQMLVQPQLSESAESTQREESEIHETLTTQQQQQQQCQQQTIALVSPRVEQQQQSQQQTLATDQQQTVPSSSTQSVSTSHTAINHKRPRSLESSSTASTLGENIDGVRQEQSSSPKSKRSRPQDLASSTPVSVTDIEYQVPTSSQRDQDEEGEDSCVVVVDCDEGGTDQPQEEEFDNDPYEELEEELPYNVEVEGDNNEVEIIIEEDSANVDVARQTQAGVQTNQQQSEAISSAGTTGDASFTSRSSRGVAPMPRQPQQHLLLPQQGFEDAGDDCIVPSTPTLFVPRRNDGFGEAISSPQVPQVRFTFGDATPISNSITQSLNNATMSSGRTVFSSPTSGLAQVVQGGMDDTRIDLTQLEEGDSGRSVPTTPQEISPLANQPISVTSDRFDKQNNSASVSTESQVNLCQSIETTISADNINVAGEQTDEQTVMITDSNVIEGDDVDGNKKTEDHEISVSTGVEEEAIDTDIELNDESTVETIDDDTKEENREAEASPSSNTRQRAMAAAAASSLRGATARRSARTTFRTSRGSRPTPIVWDSQSSQRGQGVVRSHTSRGSANENSRIRGTRGRRLRSKYPYNY